jgi:hypothetical protein
VILVVHGERFSFRFIKILRLSSQWQYGNGARTLFWSDKWIHGQRVADIAPQVIAIVPKRHINRRTVLEALTNHSLVSDLQGALTVGVINEYLGLWDVISTVVLQPHVEDSFIWRFSSDDIYSAKSAYCSILSGESCLPSLGEDLEILGTWRVPFLLVVGC